NGRHAHNVPYILRLVEGGDAVEAQAPALVERILCQPWPGGEAVNHPPTFQGVLEFLENGDGVVIGIAAVDHHRQVKIAGNLQLPSEHLPLHVAVCVVVVVIEADLTNGYDLLMACMLADVGFHRIRVAFGVVGMNTLGAVDPVDTLAECPDGGQVIGRHRDGDDLLDIYLTALLKDVIQWLVFQVVQVAMGLDDRVIEYGYLTTFFAHVRLPDSVSVGAWVLC